AGGQERGGDGAEDEDAGGIHVPALTRLTTSLFTIWLANALPLAAAGGPGPALPMSVSSARWYYAAAWSDTLSSEGASERPRLAFRRLERASRPSQWRSTMTTRIYAGAGHWSAGASTGKGGLFRREADGGQGWERLGGGLPDDAEVRAIALHPRDPHVIYAGTQHGLLRSPDGGDRWTPLGLPDRGMTVWSFPFRPRDPRVLYGGTAPAAVYRSADGGESWRRLSGVKMPERVKMSFPTRVTRLAADPSRPDELYAGLEV